MKTQAEQYLQDPSLNIEQRRQVLAVLKAAQTQLKAANPLLEVALNSKSYGIGKQEDMLINLKGIIKDKNFNMTDATRNKMQVAVSIFDNGLDAIRNTDYFNVVNDSQYKQDVKTRVLDALYELGGAQGRKAPQDPVLAESIRAIFEPILDFYVRNNLKAGQ